MPDVVRITRDPLGLADLTRELGHAATAQEGPGVDDEAGAFVTFSGIVRRREGERSIDALDYSHYAGMAERELQALVEEARRRWPLRAVGVVHRVGRVPVGEPSVVVAVSAGHRAEAFEAARFLIDTLKLRVPIWKQAGG